MQPGMGAELSRVPLLLPAYPYGQRDTCISTNLAAGRRPLANLREIVGRDVRAIAGVVSQDTECPSMRSHAIGIRGRCISWAALAILNDRSCNYRPRTPTVIR